MDPIDSSKTTHYPGLILPTLALAAFIIAYLPVWRSLVSAWSESADYSHGFFIIPLSLFILWRKRKTFEKLQPQPSKLGLVLVIGSLFTYIFARFAQIITLSSLSMIPLFAGIILYLYGYAFLRESVFALFLLFFMIPIPSQIYSALTIHLQLAVTKASVLIAGMLGVPVYREGNVIHLADRTLQVVRACSGMRSMISLLALSAVFGYFTLRSNILRSLLFFSGIPVAVAVNIFRVVLMILFFQYLGYDLTKGAAHTAMGLAVFLLAVTALALLKGFLSPWDRSLVQS